MHRIFRIKAYEAENGPHFNEEKARKAVSKMENEDGSKGPHWSLEEAVALANQYSIRLDEKFNKYDWCVTLNMIYSDYYKVIVGLTNSNNTKHFVDFTKAWLCDKDIEEGKMWFYYIYIMCSEIRDVEEMLYEKEYANHDSGHEKEEEDEYEVRPSYRRDVRSSRPSVPSRRSEYRREYDEDDAPIRERDYEPYSEHGRGKSMRYVRF